jgi:phage/plasmid primase-like uncharacterized protein
MRSAAWNEWVDKARAVPIENEVARRSIKLNGHKIERHGPCPKCGGEDRFSINTSKRIFNCRGCETGGDVITLVEFLDGTDFTHAVETLTGEPPPKPNGKRAATPRRSSLPNTNITVPMARSPSWWSAFNTKSRTVPSL